MLIQMEIKNFAIIKHSLINFEEGFNVITGETGAGKSILLDALSSLLGERTSKSLVRKGEEKAELKAVFFKTETLENKLREKGIEIEDDVIIVKRIISKNGRNIVKINGSIHTIHTLRNVCDELIEICGQKEYQTLFNEDKYLHWIDEHATPEHERLLNEYKSTFAKWNEVSKSLSELLYSEREKEQLLDLYKFQKEEIEKVDLKDNEDEVLEEEKKFLSGYEKISKNISNTVNKLDMIDEIFASKSLLEEASNYDEKLKTYAERIERAYYELEDVKSEVTDYLYSIEYDEEKLNQVMYRIDVINGLKRKYADTIEGILSHFHDVSSKIYEFENKDERIKALQQEQKDLELALEGQSNDLHLRRIDIAKNQSDKITESVRELCMPDAVFKFECEKTDRFDSNGITKVKILFNANKGEDLQPLSKIASGGELSRVLLAMKISDEKNENVSTLIFDEVDEGIGGEVGRVIGEKLLSLSHKVQVISISHLPQVAAKADTHFLIRKKTEDDRTVSEVEKLKHDHRRLEIARMIYGDEKNETTLKQAEEMLKK